MKAKLLQIVDYYIKKKKEREDKKKVIFEIELKVLKKYNPFI